MEYKELGPTGIKVSSIALGGAPLGGVYNEVDELEALKVVKYAIDMGINYIDTAPLYGEGKSESRLGKALQVLPRNAYYLATKVGHYSYGDDVTSWFDFSRERTVQSVHDSLNRLGLDYIDMIQVHDVEFASTPEYILNETLPVLQELQKTGKVRHIGISGYNLAALRTIIERSTVPIDTVLSYCRMTLHDNSLKDHLQYFKDKGVGVINASPFSMGLLTPGGPQDWHLAGEDIRTACKQATQLCKHNGIDICKLALKWSCSCKDVCTTIFGTSHVSELEKNLRYSTEPLTQHESKIMQEILDEYMLSLENKNWEGVEEKQYWELMENTACEGSYNCDEGICPHTVKNISS